MNSDKHCSTKKTIHHFINSTILMKQLLTIQQFRQIAVINVKYLVAYFLQVYVVYLTGKNVTFPYF